VANIPASATYGAAGIVMVPRYSGAAQGYQTFYSGKKYFEIFAEGDNGVGTTWDYSIGIRQQAATTLTWGANPTIGAVSTPALIVCPHNQSACRYGVTLTWSASASMGALGTMSPWMGVAVDFDTGKMWVGIWNEWDQTMRWGTGSDPAAGTNPHMTFTASTTMRIFMTFGLFGASGTSDRARYVMVQDDNNVIGLPSGFTTWGGTAPSSTTATPSGTGSVGTGSGSNVWPFGITS